MKPCEAGKVISKTDKKKRCVIKKPLTCSSALGKEYNRKTMKCRSVCNKTQVRQKTMRKRCVQKCKRGSRRVGSRNRCQSPCPIGKVRSLTDPKHRCIKGKKEGETPIL